MEKEQLTVEDKKQLSRKRIFYGIIGLSIVMGALILWEIFEFFIH